jgi:hypothetical protein
VLPMERRLWRPLLSFPRRHHKARPPDAVGYDRSASTPVIFERRTNREIFTARPAAFDFRRGSTQSSPISTPGPRLSTLLSWDPEPCREPGSNACILSSVY